MRRAMEYSLGLDMVLAQHCEVARLTQGAVMHEGRCCSELGLPGWPALAEELMVHRDLELSRLTGARIHLLHLSTARSVELVRAAKADGHRRHRRGGAPPLHPHRRARSAATTRCSRSTRRCARPPTSRPSRPASPTARSTPSPPTTRRTPTEDKERPIDDAPPGMLGLETALGVALAELDLPLAEVLAALSWKPAAIAGVADRHGGPIAARQPGQPGGVRSRRDVAGAPGRAWPAAAATRPYVGRTLRGRVRHTIFRGAPVVVDGVAQR